MKACLFDMDGVIVDTARFHFKAWHRLADSLGIQFTEEDNEQLKGVSRVDSLEKILSWGNLMLNNTKKIELMDLKNKWYLEYVEEVNPSDMLPGVYEFLKELKAAGIRIGLGSSSKNSILILEKLGIYDLFDTIMDGNKIHMSKPHPEVFERGAAELGIPPEQIVVFEDAISGVDAALSGGFYCIGIGDSSVLSKAHAVVPDMKSMTIAKMVDLLH
ncbi:MAG: beta-phosphoglucomutase [Flavobacteriales bacterium]|nr:beta-phosphoglucomutase [Flavobacteriales bacterium]